MKENCKLYSYLQFSKNNHINGFGFMIWNNLHEKYTGQWLNDKQEGIGIQTWYDGKGDQKFLYNRYVGEWKEGKRHGYGVFFYANGTKYEGTWFNNLKQGFGVLTYQDGKQYIGLFDNDQMVNEENITIEMINKIMSKEKETKGIVSPRAKKGSNNNIKNKSPPKRGKSFTGMINLVKKPSKTKALEMIAEQNEGESAGRTPRNTNPNGVSTNTTKVTKKTIEALKNKNLNSFQPYLEYSDLIKLNPDIENSKAEIENLFLRNLTEIRRWYIYSVKDANETDEQKEKKDKELSRPPYCINSNKVSFCMEMKDLWRFFRDVGLCSGDFSLASFNRIFYNEGINQYEMFYIPSEYENFEVYEYLVNIVNDSKNNFANSSKVFVDYYSSLPQSNDKVTYSLQYLSKIASLNPVCQIMPAQAQGKTIVTTILNAINSHIPEQLGITQKANHLHFNIHDNHQIVLLRHFYSALIRATYLKYMFDERPFDQKLKTVLSMCNAAKPQFKRGRGNKSMQSRLESSFIQKENQQLYEQNKKRMTEYKMIDDFINDNEVKLKPIFLHLYMKSSQGKIFNYDDMTVTYDYFYQKIIRKSSLLRELYDSKLSFIEIINYFHKDKKYFDKSAYDSKESYEEMRHYINDLMDYEFIFYEFIEMVFFMCRKYIMRKRLNEDKQHYLDLINHIWTLVKVDPVKEAERAHRGKGAYTYPKQAAHHEIERMNEIKRNEEELRRLQKLEVERYMKEREAMDNDKENAYIEEKKESEDSDDSDI